MSVLLQRRSRGDIPAWQIGLTIVLLLIAYGAAG